MEAMKLHLDFETRSRVDLKKVGLWAYALHPSTDVTCMGFGHTPGDLTVWTTEEVRGGAQFDGFKDAIIVAHNAPFEYAVYNLILHRRYGWPALWEPSRWRCTMARALACGLPPNLDTLGRVLKIKTPKDLDGKKAMLRVCKPLADGAFDESSELYARLYAYNAVDVRAEMEVDELLPDLSPEEQKVWELDLVMNRRGVMIDLAFAKKAAALSGALVADLDEKLKVLTAGAVDKATRVQALKYYLHDRHGVEAATLDKESVTDIMADPLLPNQARDVLAIRRQVGKKNSVAKYDAAVAMACPDSRVRGLLQYHAAHTGRWGGRGLQPQNFPKGWDRPEQQTQAISSIMDGVSTMDALSNSLRGLFIASPGKTLVCADFNAIEARVLFWLAGEQGALAAYRRGESPYLNMGEALYRRKITKHGDPQEHDISKRTVLGCGYGMGAKKFRDNIYAETAKKGKPTLVSRELAALAVKTYREKYAGIPNLWRETERAAVLAVHEPGKVFPCAGGKVLWGMSKDRRFLGCKLPSGRFLRYYHPGAREETMTFCDNVACPHVEKGDVRLCPKRFTKPVLRYEAMHPVINQWAQVSVWGGALVENVTQAVARDLLVNGMWNIKAAGFEPVLTVHDEVLAEFDAITDVDQLLANFIKQMTTLPVWAAGCPVAAEGWVGPRYRK